MRIEGYRCLEHVTLDLGPLTVLLGSNSTGKSSVFKAMHFFFEEDSLTAEDVFSEHEPGHVTVQATFFDLTDADRAVFGVYALGEQMVLRRTWRDGDVKLTGRGLRYSGFESVRSLSGVQKRTAYKQFRDAQPDFDLPDVSRVDEADDAMLNWEMAHPDQCEASDDDASHLFGYPSVGKRKLSDRFKFVFVPGLQDAAEEAVERKGTILERLLTAIADQRSEANQGLAELEDRLRGDYSDLVERTHRPTLDGLADSLRDQMRRYVPTAEMQLEPIAAQLKIAAPLVRLRGGEEHHLTDLGRQGHGFQRTFIIAALEYLAATQGPPDEARPTLFLAIEEPELYQHPPRAMHFASTLRSLALRDETNVQVSYATHSPYFVTPSDFDSVRIFRRGPHADGESASPTTITAADAQAVIARLPDDQREHFDRRLIRTLRSNFREAFFARAVLLVEGDTDAAVFAQAGRMSGVDLSSHGVVSAAITMSVLPLAHCILKSLGIPTYVVFDADYREDGNQSDHTRENRRILECLGAPLEDFPATQHNGRWASFAINLEHYLAVVPEEVPNACEGWLVADGGVASLLVVVVEPVWQGFTTGCA